MWCSSLVETSRPESYSHNNWQHIINESLTEQNRPLSNGSIIHGLSSDSLRPWRDKTHKSTTAYIYYDFFVFLLCNYISEWIYLAGQYSTLLIKDSISYWCGQAILEDWILLCWPTCQSNLYEHMIKDGSYHWDLPVMNDLPLPFVRLSQQDVDGHWLNRRKHRMSALESVGE